MCFHSKQSKDAQTLEKRYKAKIAQPDTFKTGNMNGFEHPFCPVITNKEPEIIQLAQWGLLPTWAKDKNLQNNTLNAKLETIHEKPSFKASITQRCLIPADGFYEWQWLDSKGRQKQKYLLSIANDELFSFAGLWNTWIDNQTGQSVQTYTILTTQANDLMALIHNSKKRMPVIIDPQAENDWLNTGAIALYNDKLQATILHAAKDQLSLWD